MEEPPLFTKKLDELLPPDPKPGKGESGRAPHSPSRLSPRTSDSQWTPSRWWQFGLIGAVVLSYSTAIKIVRAVLRGNAEGDDWSELPAFAAMIFGAGFLCGFIVWVGRRLYQYIGLAGDAIVGLAVMLAFFCSVMLVTEPEMLGEKFAMGGGPMLIFAAIIGPIAGAWIGRDLRKQS